MRGSGRTKDQLEICIAAARCGQNVLFVCQNYVMQKYCFDLAMSIAPDGETRRNGMKILFEDGSLKFKSVSQSNDDIRGVRYASMIDHSVRFEKEHHRLELQALTTELT
jgi:hypothetical protein